MPVGPGYSVPSDLLHAAWQWEATREHWFNRMKMPAEAANAHRMALIYAARIEAEHGITIRG